MPKLLDQIRNLIRLRHYSYRTEQAYVHWIRQYIFFHNKTHPAELGAPQVEAFPTHLAVERHVAASTQNQALAAILFLYRNVLQQDLAWLEDVATPETCQEAGSDYGSPPEVCHSQEARQVFPLK